jgi:hypothetical protein
MTHPELMIAVWDAKSALILSQRGLAEVTGSSHRTVQRWAAGRSSPSPREIARLAVAVHPRNPEIAQRLASWSGQTLESFGIAPPPAALPASPAPAPLPSGPDRAALLPVLVESVVAAAAEALDVSPRVARPAVLAAMERATVAALTVEDLLGALRPAPAAKPPPG